MNQSPDGPITKLPGAPDWRALPHEAHALFLRVLTHLARRVAEANAGGLLLEARDTGRAICLAQHCWHHQFPCMVCRTWLPPALLDRLTARAMQAAESKGRNVEGRKGKP